MRPISALAFIALFFAAAPQADARPKTRYLEIINRAHDSLVTLEVAAVDSGVYQKMRIDTPLQGGGDSTTVEVAGESCIYDLRFVFVNGRALIYPATDICRHPRVHVQRLPPLK